MENHFTESGEATFFAAPCLLVHFSLKKLFGRALSGFSRESALGALPNAP